MTQTVSELDDYAVVHHAATKILPRMAELIAFLAENKPGTVVKGDVVYRELQREFGCSEQVFEMVSDWLLHNFPEYFTSVTDDE
jgi:hypothetical protein